MSDLVAVLESPKTLQEFKRALPQHLTAERFARICVTEMRKNPDLLKCSPASVLSCLIQSAQLGLEPGNGLGHAYLIPFRNKHTGTFEATFIVGYKGYLALARRSGNIKRISAQVVYAGDEFDYSFGSVEYLSHKPCGDTNMASLTHGYAVAEFKDGGIQIEVMTRKQIDAIKNRGRANPVWNSDYSEMARKTLIRRIAKYLPLSPEMADALRYDQEDDIALPEQPSPEKKNEYQDAEYSEQKLDTAVKEREIALSAFTKAWKTAEGKGGNPDVLIGMSFEEAQTESTNFLEAATEKLTK